MLDSRQRFAGTAEDYDRFRPDYPAGALDWLLGQAGVGAGDAVVDLGCGTGILTRALAARGLRVTGVDPSEPMLQRARARGGPAAYVRGEATATGLAAASCRLVTAAQCFHWFDLGPTLAELGRVLVPGGRVAALWNLRAETPLLAGYERLVRDSSRDYGAIARPEDVLARLRAWPGVTVLGEASFAHRKSLDLEGLLGRARSTSYVVHGVEDRAGFERELAALFAAHARDGRVDFDYRTAVLLFAP